MTKHTHTHGCREKVLDFLSRQSKPLNTQAVADGVGITHKGASMMLCRLVEDGDAKRPSKGLYAALTPKAAKASKAVGTTPTPAGVGDLLTKLNELSQERSSLDSSIAALETALQLLGYRPRKTRKITDQQWEAIGRKAAQ